MSKIKLNYKQKQCGIYCIINKINNKVYIGSSVNCYHRIRGQHLPRLRNGKHTNPHLQLAFNKYKEKSFDFFIIEVCKQNDLSLREQYYMKLYNSLDHNFGYNINADTTNCPLLTNDQKLKITMSKLGRSRGKTDVGITRSNSSKNWIAIICYQNKDYYLGTFRTKKIAREVYKTSLARLKNGFLPELNNPYRIKIATKSVNCFDKNGSLVKHYSKMNMVRADGYNPSLVGECCSGKRKTHAGFIWKLSGDISSNHP